MYSGRNEYEDTVPGKQSTLGSSLDEYATPFEENGADKHSADSWSLSSDTCDWSSSCPGGTESVGFPPKTEANKLIAINSEGSMVGSKDGKETFDLFNSESIQGKSSPT